MEKRISANKFKIDNLLRKINSLYNFSTPVKLIRNVQKGCLTKNYIVGSGNRKYFLKQYIDDLARVKNTHIAKKYFSQNGIPAILPIATKNKKTYFIYEKKIYAIFPFCQGRQFVRTRITRKALISAGKMLAKIHLLDQGENRIKVMERSFSWDKSLAILKLEEIKKIILSKIEKTSFDKTALGFLELKLKLIKKNRKNVSDFKFEKNSIIHADYHESNMFFDENSDLKHIFDWEMVSFGPRIFDVVKALDFICFYGKYEEKNFRMAKFFLQTYHKLYPIDRQELEWGIRAAYLGRIHCSWILEEHYLKNNNRVNKFFRYQQKFNEYFSNRIEEYIKKMEKCII
jgi:Ser/Thr protein kinase RdoA (MazF antagonist)